MISVCREFVDVHAMVAVTELVNSFGKKHVVQTPMLVGDHAADVEQVKAEMEAREAAFIARLRGAPFSYSEERIAAMQKKPGDCGCQ